MCSHLCAATGQLLLHVTLSLHIIRIVHWLSAAYILGAPFKLACLPCSVSVHDHGVFAFFDWYIRSQKVHVFDHKNIYMQVSGVKIDMHCQAKLWLRYNCLCSSCLQHGAQTVCMSWAACKTCDVKGDFLAWYPSCSGLTD